MVDRHDHLDLLGRAAKFLGIVLRQQASGDRRQLNLLHADDGTGGTVNRAKCQARATSSDTRSTTPGEIDVAHFQRDRWVLRGATVRGEIGTDLTDLFPYATFLIEFVVECFRRLGETLSWR